MSLLLGSMPFLGDPAKISMQSSSGAAFLCRKWHQKVMQAFVQLQHQHSAGTGEDCM